MFKFTYQYMHVPTGKRFEGVAHQVSEVAFLRLLNHWNATDPARWHYWSKNTLGVRVEERGR